MIFHVAGLVYLETAARHILICVNIVSGLEHSFNYTQGVQKNATPRGRPNIFGDSGEKHPYMCEYSKWFRKLI